MSISYRNLRYGGIIVSYACSAACAHCNVASSPWRNNAYITMDTANRIFDAMAAQGCRQMHIGGGEPFLRPDALVELCSLAKKRGFIIDYIETNSSWATDLEHTISVLSRLKAQGIDTFCLSISPYHMEHVPLERVKTMVRAIHQTGMHAFLWRDEFWEELDDMGPGVHSRAEFEARYGADYWVDAARRYGVGLSGRARETYHGDHRHYPADEVLTDERCRGLFNTGHFHVDAFGYYTGCNGVGVQVEDLALLPGGKYPFIECMHKGGVEALYNWAQSEYGFAPYEAGYIDSCHLCSHIREFLALDTPYDGADLHPAEHYSQLRGERCGL